jgi:nitrate/nitrite transport system substrate-binding protein
MLHEQTTSSLMVPTSKSGLTRRDWLVAAGAFAATSLLKPGYAWAADAPEVAGIKIGFVGQADAAPLIMAKEKGYFAKYGLKDVQLVKLPSYAVIRDNLELGGDGGGIDASMVLRPIGFLMSLGAITKRNRKVPMYTPLVLNIDGQGITVANEFKGEGPKLDSSVIRAKVLEAKAQNRMYKFASTFPGGTGDLMMRYWLAAGGIDPENDVQIITVPAGQLVPNMKIGNLAGFCVGDPWHARIVNKKIGYTALVTGEFWRDHPEKALTMRAPWVDKYPKATKAVLMAVMEAQQWCDVMPNRDQLAKILSGREYTNVPAADLLPRMKGIVDYGDGRVVQNSPYLMRFWKNNASYPYKSHDLWFLTENVRWGKIPPDFDGIRQVVAQGNREDLWRAAAKELGVTQIPKNSSRGIETFLPDKVKFDPKNPEGYLASLKIKRVLDVKLQKV